MKTIYLDCNASTPVDSYVIEKIVETMKISANPHSIHLDGRKAMELIDHARESFAQHLDCFEDEIFFTSGATESNNIAILGSLERFNLLQPSKKNIYLSRLEHRSVIEPILYEANRLGLNVVWIPVTFDGLIDINFLDDHLSSDALLVAVCAVNSEIGTVQPIEQVGRLCKIYNSLFLVDATQAAYETIKPAELGISFLSMSAHKIYGPMGVGLLYVDNALPFNINSLMHGGSQQNNLRPGTIPTHQIVGFVEAYNLLKCNADEKNQLECKRNYFLNEIVKNVSSIKVNGSLEYRHPGNLNLRLYGVDARTLVNNVQNELSISTGAACSSGIIKPSDLLVSMGLSDNEAYSSFRLCVGRYTTYDEIDEAINIITKVINYDIIYI